MEHSTSQMGLREWVEGPATVSYSHVPILRDIDEHSNEDHDPLAIGFPDSIRVGPDGFTLRTAISNHQVLVRMEQWASEPTQLPVSDPADTPDLSTAGAWEVCWQAVVPVSAAGTWRAWTVAAGPEDWSFQLPHGGTWAVRVYGGGRSEVRARYTGTAEVGGGGDLELDGVERFLIQMWPTPDQP